MPEMKAAWRCLDVDYDKDIDQNFEHRNFNRQGILDTLIELREKYQPTLVFTHSSFDHHQDHKVIYQETIRAFKHTTILGYSLEWNNVTGCDLRYFKRLDYTEVQAKLLALDCYKSQAHRTYFKQPYQLAQMQINGQLCGSDWAEKFEVIRLID
jgi:LmbE family N-acetylglucosaminyl deacetylase